MIDTTLLFDANMEAIFLTMLSVRWTLVELECHVGYEILCPELSNLRNVAINEVSLSEKFAKTRRTRSDCLEHHASQR